MNRDPLPRHVRVMVARTPQSGIYNFSLLWISMMTLKQSHCARIKLLLWPLTLALAGCLTSGDGDVSVAENPAIPDPGSNSAPTISGTPASTAIVDQAYSFTPTASDSNGDTLTFSVQNLPTWSSFNTATGNINGTPAQGDEGNYANIQISVSDGSLSTTLPAFAVNVTQSALGSASLSWNAPTQNSDGSPLLNLAGYRIYYGLTPSGLSNIVDVNNAGLTTYVIDNLAPNTYYFSASALNADGIESDLSNVVSMNIQ